MVGYGHALVERTWTAARLDAVQNLMANTDWSLEKTLTMLGIPSDSWEELKLALDEAAKEN